MKICCFTGHRTIPGGIAVSLTRILDGKLEALAAEGYTVFRTGGARGFDTLAALRVLALRDRRPDCRLHLILPCRDQNKSWREGERELFAYILSKADQVDYVSLAYTPTCMHARNRALVEGSDCCVAFLQKNCGGTLYTCSYALKQKVPLVNLADELPN